MRTETMLTNHLNIRPDCHLSGRMNKLLQQTYLLQIRLIITANPFAEPPLEQIVARLLTGYALPDRKRLHK